MLHSGNFNKSFDYSDIDDDEQPADDEEDEVDNYIKGPDVLHPIICKHCKKYYLELRRYDRKDPEKNVLYCENDGYLCKVCGDPIPRPSKRPRKTEIMCVNGHSLYS